MERRGFLKALGIGIAGAVVAPLGDARADQNWITTDEGVIPFIRGRSMVGWMPMRYQGPEFKMIHPFWGHSDLRDASDYVNTYKIGWHSGKEMWVGAGVIVPITATQVALMQDAAMRPKLIERRIYE